MIKPLDSSPSTPLSPDTATGTAPTSGSAFDQSSFAPATGAPTSGTASPPPAGSSSSSTGQDLSGPKSNEEAFDQGWGVALYHMFKSLKDSMKDLVGKF